MEEQEIPFLEDAIKKMEFVRREQIDCDVPVTVTEENISKLKKELEELLTHRAETVKEASDKSKESEY